jgi:hypothetical protein
MSKIGQQVGRNSDSVLRRMIEGQIRRNARWLLRRTRYAVLGNNGHYAALTNNLSPDGVCKPVCTIYCYFEVI